MSLIKFSRLKFSLLKSLILCFLVLGASWAQAQEASSTTEITPEEAELQKSFADWSVNVSTLNWNDKLKLRQGITTETEFANYNAVAITIQKEFNIKRWGYVLGVFFGSGQANGGGNSSVVTYQQSKVNFMAAGLSPRVFYRLSDKVSGGVSSLIFNRSITWPTDNNINVDAGRSINATILADLNFRIFNHWDFYQGVGPLAEGATMWKLGLGYRF
jgi:hypothetical protein